MAKHALLEINLARAGESLYNVDLRYERPGDKLETTRAPGTATIDLRKLFDLRLDRPAYGTALTQSLLASPEVKELFKVAYRDTVVDGTYEALRIRVYIDRLDSPLHNVWWETLIDPEGHGWLLTNERVLFSRYLGRSSGQSVRLGPHGSLRVLLCVANPRELLDQNQEYEESGRRLYPVEVDEEVQRARDALSPVVLDVISSDPRVPGVASLENLRTKLREGYDVLYLVCHGALTKPDPQGKLESVLWLDEAKSSSRVLGSSFVDALRDLAELPRLVVLASCQSAGIGKEPRKGDEGAMAALGPQLARAGVAGVVAMQGSVSMETVAGFMPAFFTELRKDGQIDRAMAVARGAVRNRPDSWMPALFLAVKDGRVWANPGEVTGPPGFKKWDKLIANIQAGECAVVLGSAPSESVLGSQQQIARDWARKVGLPLTEHGRDDMPYVAQFIATMEEPAILRKRWLEAMEGELRKRYLAGNPAGPNDLPFEELVEGLGAHHRAKFPDSPHALLARLPIKIFVTTAHDDLLAEALRAEKKKPVVEFCRWNQSLDGIKSLYDREDKYTPSEKRPLVYHLLGMLDEPNSLVLTEDHYLDYLTRIRIPEARIPLAVERALQSSPLLILGFQTDDWDFRVLFRSIAILRAVSFSARKPPPSVAVQLSPDDRFLQPPLVQAFMEKYFDVANVELSWGSQEAFVRELWRQWTSFLGGRNV